MAAPTASATTMMSTFWKFGVIAAEDEGRGVCALAIAEQSSSINSSLSLDVGSFKSYLALSGPGGGPWTVGASAGWVA